MGTRISRLNDEIESFIIGYWDTDVRDESNADALPDLVKRDLYHDMQRFLRAAYHGSVTPKEWQDLCNVKTPTDEAMRKDIIDLWHLLFSNTIGG